jgi:hypothetical protein
MISGRRIPRITCVATLLLAAAGFLSAQPTSSQINGRISDSSGAVIPQASVTATNVDTGIKYQTASNASGYYLVALLPSGNYRLDVRMEKFRPVSRSGIVVQTNQSVRIDFVLEVGTVTQTMDVSAETPIIESDVGSVGHTVNNRLVTQLPAQDRNIYTFMLILPGAAADANNYTRVNGARARGNEYLVDGVTQVEPETRTGVVAAPPVDSIQEFKVLTSNFSAEFGNVSGGLVSVASKSGTNAAHGTLWEFFRNNVLNTRNLFQPVDQPKPILRQNNFGAAGGGPVWIPRLYDGRNRTFFFVSYDGLRQRDQSIYNINVPTAAMKAGDFSALVGAGIGTDSLGRAVRQGQIYDPTTQSTVNGQSTRLPFPNDVIPVSRFDPAAIKLMQYYPEPTNGALTQNYRRARPRGNTNNRYDARIDHNLSSTNRFFGRFSGLKSDPITTAAFTGATGDWPQNDKNTNSFTGVWTSNVRPTVLNELRVAFLRSATDRKPYQAGTDISSLLGIANLDTRAGLPNIVISNVTSLGSEVSGGYLVNTQRVYSLMDNVSIMRGRHALRAGVDVRFYRLKAFQPTMLNGKFSFAASQTALPGTFQSRTGNAFASFLLGQVSSTQFTQKDPGQLVNGNTYAAFIQDDWKLSSRLTLNLGVRYELNTRVDDKRGYSSTLDLTEQRVLAGSARPEVPLDRNNFAPRVSLAWDIAGNQRTVIRTGFGIYYQPVIGGGGNPLAGVIKFPYEFTSTANSANGLAATTTLSGGPGLLPVYDAGDPRLGYGGDAAVQAPNTAPYTEQWSFGVERVVRQSLAVGLSYVGSGGRKLDAGRYGYINLNQVPIEVVRQASVDQRTQTPNTSKLRPYPNFNLVQLYLPRYGNSNYHSLQAKAEQRLRSGLGFLFSYTWAKNIDNGAETFNFNGGSYPQDVYNLDLERAVSTADTPHRFTAAYVWDLPFGRGRKLPLRGVWNALGGGWQLSGVTTLSGGRPIDVEQSTNTTNTYSQLQRPNLAHDANLSRDDRTMERFFDVNAFAAATPLAFGTSPRNPVRGPGRVNFDASVNKNFSLLERKTLEFRFEMFNFTNTPPLSIGGVRTTYNPNLALDRQTFGRVTSAGNGRVLQLALKFKF